MNRRFGPTLATPTSAVPSRDPAATHLKANLVWKKIIECAEPFLNGVASQLASQIQEFEAEIIPFARYALTAQGKQLRPTLVALSGGAVGEVSESHIRVAVIIEMVHLATLVHDDVMDGASVRRSRPTVAANWGNEVSVLLGDCLFAQALKLAASFPTTEVCRAVASATNTVCSGEILQTGRRGKLDMKRAEYFRLLQMKTGELFALSCDLGSYLSGCEGSRRMALRQYGMAVGTAYQIYDDCLDLFGSEALAGKSLGTDLAKGKLTLPVLLLLERAEQADRLTVEGLIQDWQPDYTAKLVDLLRSYRALEDSRLAVHQHLQTARQKLAALPESDSRAALALLTEYIGQQTDALAMPV